MWRRGETDGGSRGKEPAGKQSGGGGGEREPRRRKKGGLAARVSLMKHSWQSKPTALSWQASPHQPVDIIIQPSKCSGPHTHSWPAAPCCTASVCDLWFKSTHTKCLFMLLQSGIYTHQLITHCSLYAGWCYVLWLLAWLLLDLSHTSSNRTIQVQFGACVKMRVCVHACRNACYTLCSALCFKWTMLLLHWLPSLYLSHQLNPLSPNRHPQCYKFQYTDFFRF